MAETDTRFSTEGLVIREVNVGESDRLVTLFTRDYGILKAYAPGAKSIKSKKGAATSLLTYSAVTFSKKKDTLRITEASPIALFFSVGSEIETLALSQYFCELAYEFGESGNANREMLRLILNSLHFLCKEKRYPPLIKAITELRLASISGYSPNLVACEDCGTFEDEKMYFNFENGSLKCSECGSQGDSVVVDEALLSAMRHIVYSEFSKLYSFTLGEKNADRLSDITSRYITLQSDRRFKTLEFYNECSLSKR